MRKIFLFVNSIFLILVLHCQNVFAQEQNVKNVILLIGDGMGVSHVYAAMAVSQKTLNIERSDYFGFSKTYSVSDFITDSGAGATALATGKKTGNKSISVDKSGNRLKTISEYAQGAGLSTGVVVTCNLTHATPSAFITHNSYRYNNIEIASSFVDAKFDIIIGGGAKLFDSLGVTDSLKTLGYQVQNKLSKIDVNTGASIFSTPYSNHPPSALKGRGNFLVDATRIALEKLSKNEKGFFLMVEGSQIDWASHDNDINSLSAEVIDFDKAIGVAYDFADKNPGTLVIVTADHETGGLALVDGSVKNKTIEAKFSSNEHTGVMVPIFSYGAGAEEFSAIMENTDVYYKMMSALGLD